MDPAQPSAASEADVQLYAEGSCHVFALALHRRLGTGFLVVTDPGRPYWEDPADADNVIPSVTHVYALAPDGTAWDVRGARPVEAVPGEVRERWPDVLEVDTDAFGHEGGLATYVDDMGGAANDPDETEVDRPLHAVSEADIDEAWDCALRILDGLPGFEAPAPSTP